MRIFSLFLLLTSVFGIAELHAWDKPKAVTDDKVLLQGTWDWDADHEHLRIQSDDVVKVTIKGNQLRIEYSCEDCEVKQSHYSCELVLWPDGNPKEFDTKSVFENLKGRVEFIGIYAIKENKLTLAYRKAYADSTRPKSFEDLKDGKYVTDFIWLKKSK